MSIARKQRIDADRRLLRHRTIAIGTALLILGFLAVLTLFAIDRLSTLKISMAMLAAGTLQISHAIGAYRRGWSIFLIIGSLLYLTAAGALLLAPFAAERAITVLLVGSLAASGTSRLMTAASLGARMRVWEAISGSTSVVVAVIVAAGFPDFSIWPLAFIIALDLIVEGAALANVGFAMGKPPRR